MLEIYLIHYIVLRIIITFYLDLEDFLKQFPIQFNMKQVTVGKMWHHTSEEPSTVILENPPVEVRVQDVKKYLENIGVNATTTVSQNSVVITLNDPSGSNTMYSLYIKIIKLSFVLSYTINNSMIHYYGITNWYFFLNEGLMKCK